MSTALIRSRGASLVSVEELAEVQAPSPQGRWFPLSHATVHRRVVDTLEETGFRVEKQELALSTDKQKFFGTLRLSSALADGVLLAVGVRNSTDKSFPLGFCAGSQVLVCENMAFRSELLVRRKHTRFGEQRFAADIAVAMPKLQQFREQEALRIEAMAQQEVGEAQAESIILRSFEKGIIPSNQLNAVIREWREPSFDEFRPRTLWSLFNCFTTVLGREGKQVSNPSKYAHTTMRLNALVAPLTLAV